MSPEEQNIRQVHSTWIRAVNAGDVARLLTLMTDDVVFLSPGQAPTGREAFPAGFSTAHQKFQVHCVSEVERVAVVGDVAYTTCRDSLSITPRGAGETTELAGHRMTIYRKQPDGRWLLAADAHTLTPVENPGSQG